MNSGHEESGERTATADARWSEGSALAIDATSSRDADEAFAIVGSIACSPPESEAPGEDEKAAIARTLLRLLEPIAGATGWGNDELVSLFGCTHPNPESWRHVGSDRLMHSVEVVQYLGERVARASSDEVVERRVGALTLKGTRTAATSIEGRSASRESLLLSLEVLGRLDGDVARAEAVLATEVFGVKPDDLIADDRLGTARAEALRRLKRGFRRVRIPQSERPPAPASPFADDDYTSGVLSGDEIRARLAQLLADVDS